MMESPSGKLTKSLEDVIPFTPEAHGGANLTLRSTIRVYNGGLFRLHVFLDDEEVTQMPLLITIQRAEASPVAKNGQQKTKP